MTNIRPLIAVVDDEAPVRVALRRLLTSFGFDVEEHQLGKDFVDSLAARHPDCLVLDLHMPGFDGFAVVAALRDARITLPIVVLTGRDTPQTRERARSAGIAAYLRKPVDDLELVAAISAAMETP